MSIRCMLFGHRRLVLSHPIITVSLNNVPEFNVHLCTRCFTLYAEMKK